MDDITIYNRAVKSFLNNEVLSSAKYIIETRAMPNIMDGLRVGARKIIWAALTGDLKNHEKIKMPSLIGDAMKLHYNHGDASLMNTIVQLCSTHVYRFAPLSVIGQIGSLRVPKCDTAPRYLHIKKTKYIDIFKTDSELLEQLTDDGDKVEPRYFLPIVPVVLLWRTNSPGFGFSFRSFSYDVDAVIDNCIKVIAEGTCNTDIDNIQLKPHIEGIKPENIIFNGNKNSWYNVGEYTMNLENDTLIVTDLPFDVSLEKYDEHLHELIEKGYIVKYTDLGMDGKIKYVIHFAKNRLKILSNDKWSFFQQMKLFSKIKKDTLNCIDLDGKTMLFFDNPYELIDAFVKKRLVFYNKRKINTIGIIEKQIVDLSNKKYFIELVVNDKIVINKRPIADIKKDLDSFKLPYEVLKQNIDKLTKEEIEKITNNILEQQQYLEYIKNTSIQEMYVNDLLQFKKDYCVINKKDLITQL